MTDLTDNKIRPFFHIKNFKDGVSDAILFKNMIPDGRSSEYKEGYDFGMFLLENKSNRQSKDSFLK